MLKKGLEKNKNTPIFYKSVGGQFKADVTSRKVSGYFANFNSIDSDMDIIRPGAFLKSIQERGPESTGNRKIKYLHQHIVQEMAGPLNKLYEDSIGGVFDGECEKTALGDVILERYSNGTYREHSFGYRYVWDKCSWIEIPVETAEIIDPAAQIPMMQAFECKELNLFEVSVVTFGANSNTPFIGFKGAKEDLLKELNNELNFLIKNAPNYDYELRIRQLWQKQISLAESLADNTTKEKTKPIVKSKDLDFDYICNNLKF